MSGAGSPDDKPVDCHDLRVAVVAARWHEQVMDGLLAGAQRALADYQVEEPAVVRVPGSFELPVVAGALAESGYEAVVALGVVIRGGTPHFEYVCAAATDGLAQVAVEDRSGRRLRPAHLRHRAAGPGPGRPRGVRRGQGVRGHGGRAHHGPDPAPDPPRLRVRRRVSAAARPRLGRAVPCRTGPLHAVP